MCYNKYEENYKKEVFIILNFILSSIFIILYQFLFFKFIDDFKVKNISYVIVAILTVIIHFIWTFFYGFYSLHQTFLFINFLLFFNLALIDCKHFEISGKTYKFFIIPVIGYILTNPIFDVVSMIFSFIIILFLLILCDKLVGIERIGGADVKLILIMSLLFSYYEIMTVIFVIFFINLLLWLVTKIIYIIRKNEAAIKIPMLVSVFLSFILLQYFCYFRLY